LNFLLPFTIDLSHAKLKQGSIPCPAL